MTRREFDALPICFDTVYEISVDRCDNYFEDWMHEDDYINYVREILNEKYDVDFLDSLSDFLPGGYDWYNQYSGCYIHNNGADAAEYFQEYLEYLEGEGFFEEDEDSVDEEFSNVEDTYDYQITRFYNAQKQYEAEETKFQAQDLFSMMEE